MRNEFKDYKEFFEKTGDSYIRPTNYGECIYPVTIEEMYQHFRSRLLDELEIKNVDYGMGVQSEISLKGGE